MPCPPKAVALAAGLVAALSVAALAQAPRRPRPRSAAETLVVVDARRSTGSRSPTSRRSARGSSSRSSSRSAMHVAAGQADRLPPRRDRRADRRPRPKLAAKSSGADEKAEAQKDLALASRRPQQAARSSRDPDYVSKEEIEKAEAEVKVADGDGRRGRGEQRAGQGRARAGRAGPRRAHHHAPRSTAIVIERMKNPGESVRANEAVVRLGNIDQLRFCGYVPLEYAYRVKEGKIVEIQPRLDRRTAARRCRSSRSGSAARSPSSTPRSSPIGRDRGPDLRRDRQQETTSSLPGLKADDDHLPEPGRRARPGHRARRPPRPPRVEGRAVPRPARADDPSPGASPDAPAATSCPRPPRSTGPRGTADR